MVRLRHAAVRACLAPDRAAAVMSGLVAAALLLVSAMTLAWAQQQRTGNRGWIDTIWSFSVGLAALLALAMTPAEPTRRALVAILIAIWSARLGWHILTRTRRSADDPRYARLIAGWGDAAPMKLFAFLQAQSLVGIVLVWTVLLAAAAPAPAPSTDTLVFAALAVLSVFGEALADAQLAAGKRSMPPGEIYDGGLWAYSRHPNYFFEWLYWLSLAAIAIAPPSGIRSWFALAAPAIMYFLLRYGSGVPHLEAHLERTRPEAFRAYSRRVPVFFPKLRR